MTEGGTTQVVWPQGIGPGPSHCGVTVPNRPDERDRPVAPTTQGTGRGVEGAGAGTDNLDRGAIGSFVSEGKAHFVVERNSFRFFIGSQEETE